MIVRNKISPKAGMLKKDDSFWTKVVKQKALGLMVIPFIIYKLLFHYVPIWVWVMAFQNYRPAKGIFE